MGEPTYHDFRGSSVIGLDIETCDPTLKEYGPAVRRDGYIAGVSLARDDGVSEYFPIAHASGHNEPKEKVLGYLRDQLGGSEAKTGANLMYDLDYLAEQDVKVNGRIEDVQIAEPLIDENAWSYSLERLGQKYVGHGKAETLMLEWAERNLNKNEQKNIKAHIWRMPSEIVTPYAREDAVLPINVLAEQKKIIEAEGLGDVFDLEVNLVPMLLAMRRRGVRVDKRRCKQLAREFDSRRKGLQTRLEKLSGIKDFSVNKPRTDIKQLFEKLDLPYARTAKGNPSFNAEALQACDHNIAETILQARQLDKLSGTFLGNIIKFEIDDYIHTLFHPLKTDENGTVSGRLSSSLPNLQNIPSRGALAKEIRAIFIPDEGEDWVRLDWSQIEYRFLAHYAKGTEAEAVRQMYADNPLVDFHQMIADMMGMSDNRKGAKNINFGLIYGMGKAKLARSLGVSLEEAMRLFEIYHSSAPFVKQLMDDMVAVAQRRGYIRTIMGRRRRFTFWEPRKFGHEEQAVQNHSLAREKWGGIKRAYTHTAMNNVFQGGAADAMKKAMVDIWEAGICDVLGAPLLTVHDELDWSVPRTAEAKEAIQHSQHLMEHVMDLRVPLVAEPEIGPNWGDLQNWVM